MIRLASMLVLMFLVASFFLPAARAATNVADADQPISWVDYVKALWPVFAVVAGLILTGLLLGLGTRFTTVKAFAEMSERVGKHSARLDDHETRIKLVEQACASPPTRQELSEEIGELSERMRGVEVGMDGVRGAVNTTNTYLHSLIERGLAR